MSSIRILHIIRIPWQKTSYWIVELEHAWFTLGQTVSACSLTLKSSKLNTVHDSSMTASALVWNLKTAELLKTCQNLERPLPYFLKWHNLRVENMFFVLFSFFHNNTRWQRGRFNSGQVNFSCVLSTVQKCRSSQDSFINPSYICPPGSSNLGADWQSCWDLFCPSDRLSEKPWKSRGF